MSFAKDTSIFLMRLKRLVAVGELTVRTQHFLDFVAVEFTHQIACGTAVLTRVKLTRLLGKHLANGSGEGQTRV